MFFHFSQNNSGGSFYYNALRGITHHVVIEATDYEAANARAKRIGLYFDGVGDCSCCGTRWSEQYRDDGTETPTVYDEPVETFKPWITKWMGDDPEVYVHYLDGTIVGHCTGKDNKKNYGEI